MTELIDAIERHDLLRVRSLLRAGADPNGRDPRQPEWVPLKTAVEECAEGGSIEAVVLLLRHGASVEGGSTDGATPLLIAALNSQTQAARLLLAAGADPNVRCAEGDSPLRLAVERRNHALAALLLACGADATIHDSSGMCGMSALGRAAWGLDVPMIQLLMAAGADPQAIDLDRVTALERLPPREGADHALWDAAAALLGGME